MTARANKMPPLEVREALLARVRERLTRTRDHLRAALTGRETELLYSWDDSWPPGESYGGVHRGGLNCPNPESPQGFVYLHAVSQWALPSAEAWRTASRQAHAHAGDDPARVAVAIDHHLREVGALAPDALPPRMTIAEGLARLEADAERLTADTTDEILAGLTLIEAKHRAAVGDREKLVTRWPWPWQSPAGRVLALLSGLADTVPSGDLAPGAWPAEVAPNAVATWAAPLLKTLHPAERARSLRVEADGWRTTGRPARVSFAWVSFALLYAARQEVEELRREARIRLSATKPSRAAISVIGAGGGARHITHPWQDLNINKTEGLAELVWDGRRPPVQLCLNLADDPASLNYVAVCGILDKLHEDGLRDWLILHRMAGEQGATGRIKWTWADHKAHTPYARQVTRGTATDAELEAATWGRLWQLKRAEIRLYADRPLPDGSTPWVRVGPGGLLDIPAGTRDPQGRDRLAVIKLNPAIYAGAKRNAPTPHFMLLAESAVKLPGDALSLALFLVCDWQYERAADGIIRTAATLWDYAAIREREHTPRKRWPELERTLERLLGQLAEKDHLGAWSHDGGQGDARRYHLRPPQWWKDQALHGVSPVFGKSLAATPKTGAELKAWREKHKWSQPKLATLAGVTESTIYRAERTPDKPLSPRLVARLRPL